MKFVSPFIFAFLLINGLVFSQETETWGLSGNKCQWIEVRSQLTETGIIWQKCKTTDTDCVFKFCNGPGVTNGENTEWKEDECNKYCVTLQETIPIEGLNVKSISGDSGVDLMANYFGLWYKIGVVVLGLIAVLVIVVSGTQIIFGGANDDMLGKAKARIWAAIASLILLFSAVLILRTVNPLFFT